MKTGQRIPIKMAKEIGESLGYTQVIITAFDKNTGRTHVTTWGKSLEDCDQAAQGGNFVKKALGWPEVLCHATPARIPRLVKADKQTQTKLQETR